MAQFVEIKDGLYRRLINIEHIVVLEFASLDGAEIKCKVLLADAVSFDCSEWSREKK